jgi:hypothetical protein
MFIPLILYFAAVRLAPRTRSRMFCVHDGESEGRKMRISLKAITLSSAILWGFAMLFVGLIHMAAHSYGGDFLQLMSSVYPGADTAPTLGRVLIGTLYGFVDGAFAGFVFGLLYSAFTSGPRAFSK